MGDGLADHEEKKPLAGRHLRACSVASQRGGESSPPKEQQHFLRNGHDSRRFNRLVIFPFTRKILNSERASETESRLASSCRRQSNEGQGEQNDRNVIRALECRSEPAKRCALLEARRRGDHECSRVIARVQRHDLKRIQSRSFSWALAESSNA